MSDSKDDYWCIHYSVAFTWPLKKPKKKKPEEAKGAGSSAGSKRKASGSGKFEYVSEGREWNDQEAQTERNNPRWYFQCLLAFLHTHKSHMLGDVKFTVWMHGAVGEAHNYTLLKLLKAAAAPAEVVVTYCPPNYPWQFPMSARMIPAIDSVDPKELVVVLDIHDDLQRQRDQLAYFLNVVTGETELKHNGILTYWPVFPMDDFTERGERVEGCHLESFECLRSKDGADDYKTANAVPAARATAPRGGVVARNLPFVNNGRVKWWYVDAGLFITNNSARNALREAYQGISFADHLKRMVAKTNYAFDEMSAYNQVATDEMALSQYLLAFQPQRAEDTDSDSHYLGQRFSVNENKAVILMWTAVVNTFGPYVHTLGERSTEPIYESGGLVSPPGLKPVDYAEWKKFNDTRELKVVNRFLPTPEHGGTAEAAQNLPLPVAIKAALEWGGRIPKNGRQPILKAYTSALFGSS